MFTKSRCAVLALTLAALSLAGCGRRGELEPAPESGVSARQARQTAGQEQQVIDPLRGAILTVPEQVESGNPRSRIPRGVTPPKDSFILDPLL